MADVQLYLNFCSPGPDLYCAILPVSSTEGGFATILSLMDIRGLATAVSVISVWCSTDARAGVREGEDSMGREEVSGLCFL